MSEYDNTNDQDKLMVVGQYIPDQDVEQADSKNVTNNEKGSRLDAWIFRVVNGQDF